LLAAQAITRAWAEGGVKGVVNTTSTWSDRSPDMMVRNWSNPMYFADLFGSFGAMWGTNGPSEGEGRFNTDADYAETWDRFRFSKDVEARKAACAERMERIKQDPPVLPPYRPFESWARQKSVNWMP